MEFFAFLIAAVFVEGLVEYTLKNFATGKWVKFVALALGIIFAIVYKLDLLMMLGLEAISPYVGYVVTGLIIGRGSNYVNDFMSKFKDGGAADKPKSVPVVKPGPPPIPVVGGPVPPTPPPAPAVK